MHRGKLLLVIALIVLVMDWTLGALHAKGIVSLKVFLLANLPFGAIHYWFESHWTGTAYLFDGKPVNEIWSFVSLGGTIVLQSLFYWMLAMSLYRFCALMATPPDSEENYEKRAPGWRIRCRRCGFTEHWGKYGIRRGAIGSTYTIGWCSKCRRITSHAIERASKAGIYAK